MEYLQNLTEDLFVCKKPNVMKAEFVCKKKKLYYDCKNNHVMEKIYQR